MKIELKFRINTDSQIVIFVYIHRQQRKTNYVHLVNRKFIYYNYSKINVPFTLRHVRTTIDCKSLGYFCQYGDNIPFLLTVK